MKAGCLFGLLLLGWGVAQEARGAYALCNETSHTLKAAVAYETEEDWVSVGWFQLFPGGCHVVEEGWQAPRVYYVHARAVYADPFFGGEHVFCISAEEDFRIRGRRGCHEDEHITAGFAKVHARAYQETVFAADPPYTSRKRARVAGVQRALRNNGISTIEIDGYWGRATQRAIKRFQKQRGQRPTGQISDELFTLLLNRSEAQHKGLRLCNQIPYPIWAAVGIVHQDTSPRYESRGWLRIAPQTCQRALAHLQPQALYYLYAEGVDENGYLAKRESGEPYLWEGDLRLCVQRQSFQIVGQDCIERGFQDVGFAKIETQGEEAWQHPLR